MTYLPKTSGSEEDNTEQTEELEVRFYKYLVQWKENISFLILLYLEEKITLFNEVNVCNKNYIPGYLFILPNHSLNISFLWGHFCRMNGHYWGHS